MIRAGRRRATAVGLAVGLLAACAHAPPADETLPVFALRGQGGAIEALGRDARVDVHYGFPGRWSWEFAYRAPESFRLSLRTTGDDQHFVYADGGVRAYVGDALVSTDNDAAAFRSQARWWGLVYLSFLIDEDAVKWSEVPVETLPDGTARAIVARFSDERAPYALHFDARGRVIIAEGPILIPGIGEGHLVARYSEHRRVGDHVLPFEASYRLNGEPFFDEHVERQTTDAAKIDLDPVSPTPDAGG